MLGDPRFRLCLGGKAADGGRIGIGDRDFDTEGSIRPRDDASFPDTVPAPVHDLALDMSHRLKIEIVPTLIRLEGGREIARTYGWDRGEWERVTGVSGLGDGLPEQRPGCGAKNLEPGVI